MGSLLSVAINIRLPFFCFFFFLLFFLFNPTLLLLLVSSFFVSSFSFLHIYFFFFSSLHLSPFNYFYLLFVPVFLACTRARTHTHNTCTHTHTPRAHTRIRYEQMMKEWRAEWHAGTGGATDPNFPIGFVQVGQYVNHYLIGIFIM